MQGVWLNQQQHHCDRSGVALWPQPIDIAMELVVNWNPMLSLRGAMFQITKPSDALRLLHWNKELPSASAADPLGLNLRVQQGWATSFFTALRRSRHGQGTIPSSLGLFKTTTSMSSTKQDRGRIKGVARERAMVLGAVLHHDGKSCEDGALGGSDRAIEQVNRRRLSYDLARWQHLGAPEGQFGAAYKGSLINLGLFETDQPSVQDEADVDTSELSAETQSIEVRELSALGKRLALAFDRSVRGTQYVKQQWTASDLVRADILKEFGARAGLCEIASKRATDRDALRSVFFACDEELQILHTTEDACPYFFFLNALARPTAQGYRSTIQALGIFAISRRCWPIPKASQKRFR